MLYNLYFHNMNTEEKQKEVVIPVMTDTMSEAIKEAEKLERENGWFCWGCQLAVW